MKSRPPRRAWLVLMLCKGDAHVMQRSSKPVPSGAACIPHAGHGRPHGSNRRRQGLWVARGQGNLDFVGGGGVRRGVGVAANGHLRIKRVAGTLGCGRRVGFVAALSSPAGDLSSPGARVAGMWGHTNQHGTLPCTSAHACTLPGHASLSAALPARTCGCSAATAASASAMSPSPSSVTRLTACEPGPRKRSCGSAPPQRLLRRRGAHTRHCPLGVRRGPVGAPPPCCSSRGGCGPGNGGGGGGGRPAQLTACAVSMAWNRRGMPGST